MEDAVDNGEPEEGAAGGGIDLDKDEFKLVKRFCGRMLEETQESWEDHEKAKLVMLMQGLLQMSERKFWKWLGKHADPTPELIACLGDSGLALQTQSVIQMFGSGSLDRILASLEECFESGLLDVNSDDVLQSV